MIGGLMVGLVIMLSVAAWRLSSGPISLGILTPYIESALSAPHRGLKIKLEDTILTWEGWARALDIRVLGVSARGPDGVEIAQVPELSLSLSARALAQGIIAPRNIEMFGPSLRLVRTKGGQFEMGFAGARGETGAMFSRLLAELSATPDPSQPLSYLSRFSIFSADLVLEDQGLGISWKAPDAELMMERDGEGVHGKMSLALETNDEPAFINIVGGYKALNKMFDIGIGFSDITPATFSGLASTLETLGIMEIPLQGTITLSMNAGGHVDSIGFDVTGGKGNVAFPVGLAQKLGVLPLAQRLAVDAMELKGRFEGAVGNTSGRLEIENLSLALEDGENVYLPAPFDHELPIKSLKGSGRYIIEQSRLEVALDAVDLAGPKASLSGEIDGLGWDGMTVSGEGVIHDVTTTTMADYWPVAVAPEARKWILSSFSGDGIKEAHARATLGPDKDGNLDIQTIEGGMVFEDLTANYFPPLPPVSKVSGTALFDASRFDVNVTHGESKGLTVTGGTLSFTGLNEYNQFANIDLSIEGPMKNALQMIDNDPLNYVSALGIDPETAEGSSSTRLKLGFIVEHALTPDQIKISAVSDLDGVSIKNLLFGRGLSGGRLSLAVDRRGMDVIGDGVLGNIPARFSWRENFVKDAIFKSRYDLTSRIEDIRNIGDVGLDLTSLPWEHIDGALEADITYTVVQDKASELRAHLDLKDVALSIPPLDWSKDKGTEGLVEMTLNLAGNRLTGVPRFAIISNGMDISGSATYGAKDGSLSRVDLERVIFGRTDVVGVLFPRAAGGWNANINGKSFDFSPLWEHFLVRDETGKDEDAEAGIPFSVAVDVDTVWVKGPGHLSDVSASFTHDGRRWVRIVMKSRIGEGGTLDLTLGAEQGADRDLLMTSSDAGEALRIFEIYPNMVGGTLVLSGKYDDADKNSPLVGKLEVGEYRIINAPALMQMLSIMALTGILESLQGEGLAFSELDVPYELKDGTLKIQNAKATGPSLGVTAEGTVYTPLDVVNIQGTIIPAYALNSFLGNIPLLGTLFTGVEEGGGIFAATYSITGSEEKPVITVNPLSALAPGILRNLFGLFGSGGATDESPPEEKKTNGEGTQTEGGVPAPGS